MLDKVYKKTFGELTVVLMEAARAAGVAGLETFLKENDTREAACTLNNRTYRHKGQAAMSF